jgi:hypothetical protein
VRTAECVTPPPVPVIVIGKLPVGAFLATVRVKCDVPVPVMELGLKLPVTPDGTPVADKVTAEPKERVVLGVSSYIVGRAPVNPRQAAGRRLSPPIPNHQAPTENARRIRLEGAQRSQAGQELKCTAPSAQPPRLDRG